ncbi:MAG: hypothetical protein HY426_03595 [Candidatus Levybacteria bacterium]|nr:hypothetical protein [Candidatus Levybacteria bacterium]
MDKNKNTEEELVQEFDSGSNKKPMLKILAILLVMGVLGIGSGFLIAKGTAKQLGGAENITSASQITKGTTMGSNDTSTFKDTAEGVLRVGGIDGEGQYHLERPGGESQYVYLTSSAVDLSLLKGRKVKVWGQTFAAEKAGWLMDVGRVEVLE